MDKVIGVHICAGCDIGEAVNTQSLCKVAEKEFKSLAWVHPYLCGTEGVQSIKQHIDEQGVNAVVIAACSRRVNWDVFAFPPLLVERVNLRELVAWSHQPNDENTQELAEDYLRMGITSAKKTEAPTAREDPVEKTVLVVGGGIAGMTAALEVAEAGFNAVIVEKKPLLGGWLSEFSKISPQKAPYRDLEDTGREAAVKAVTTNERIKVFTSAEVEKIAGAPGAFDVSISQNGTSTEMKIGSIVVATGWQPYDASKLENLGYGKHDDVVTGITLEQMARSREIVRPSDGKKPESVAFVLCAGSRDTEHLSYCSSVCCLTSLKQAQYIREQNPQANVYIIYKDIRTPGQYEEFYRRVQEDPQIFFTKGEVEKVGGDGNGKLVVDVADSLLGGRVAIRADLVVLATGLVPNTKDTQTLHLQYRQGPEIPMNKHSFPDSNYICFPYETQRTAIYSAGCVRQPMTVTSTVEDATGAALKAVQALQAIERGAALHPRGGDLSFPEFFLQRCTQCKRCTEECPFGALDEDVKGTPKPNPTRCRRCGVCFGACPERLISFKNYNIDQLTSMVKIIQVPDDEKKTRILGLVCENDAYAAFDAAGINRLTYDPAVRILPLRCLGSMNVALIADAVSRGIDGVILIGCKYGDDYQCHFIKGSELANKRMENIRETLGRLMIEKERVKLVQLAISEYDKVPEIVNQFVQEIRAIGPNPYKGF